MTVRGVRGATTVIKDTEDTVLSATRELLEEILASNPELKTDDLASVLFTTTEDIASVYPARAARQLGWEEVPLICACEIPVEDSLPLCIRVLIHWNTEKAQSEIRHVYLGEAIRLRPDLVNRKNENGSKEVSS